MGGGGWVCVQVVMAVRVIQSRTRVTAHLAVSVPGSSSSSHLTLNTLHITHYMLVHHIPVFTLAHTAVKFSLNSAVSVSGFVYAF